MTAPFSLTLTRTAIPLLAALAAFSGAAARLSAAPAASPGTSARIGSIELPDSEGHTRSLAEFKDRKAVVLVFIGADCPISNGCVPTLAELAERCGPRGVQFLAVNANDGEPLAEVARHARAYRFGFPVLKDEKQQLADALGAKLTPEAFVLDRQCAVRYRGRIDDAYQSRIKRSSRVASHDLEDAIEAVLAGKPVARPVTAGFGCAIARPVKTAAAPGAPNFYKDVLPVLQQRCQGCHRPGQVAPFSLLTYNEARAWAGEIKTFTQSRVMPPWLAEPGHGDFQDVRRLSDAQLRTLARWADAGAPAGKPKDGPAPRRWTEEWALGKPDLVLTPAEAYRVSAAGSDDFRVFVLPTGLAENKQVVAIDFRPGNPRVVHHVVSFVDTSGQGRKLDEQDPGPGYASGPGGIKVSGAAIQGVWAPGNLPRFLPAGVGRPLPGGADILIQVHYHKTGKPEEDRTKVALYFAREPVKEVARTSIWGTFAIDIPPDAPRHEVKWSAKLPADVRVLTIMPHMHLLGKEMKVSATFPDGKVQDLVWIKDWDYRWQDSYRYKEPLLLPKGTTVDLTAYYDNTAGNPLNPSNPPRRVRFGEQTTDEMAFAILETIRPSPVGATAKN